MNNEENFNYFDQNMFQPREDIFSVFLNANDNAKSNENM